MNKKKLFFNYAKLSHTNEFNYYDLAKNKKDGNRKILDRSNLSFEKTFKHNQLNFLTFAYFYSTEYPLYAGCNNNDIQLNFGIKNVLVLSQIFCISK